ncbi:MAG: DUF488 domain-containing protein [Pirellulales bacterium]|nr:DUF488 domain-containing protein [Pirellulales bacterium]
MIYTLGHSTRSIDEFADLLLENGVQRVLDVRRFPGSRKFPHFTGDTFQQGLEERGIGYTHLPELGGRRSAGGADEGGYWRNASFRGYAKYMQSPEFRQGMERLLALCDQETCALVCAEAVPWRCHRSLIADWLVAAGHSVTHIMGKGKRQPHTRNPNSRLMPDGTLVYVA